MYLGSHSETLSHFASTMFKGAWVKFKLIFKVFFVLPIDWQDFSIINGRNTLEDVAIRLCRLEIVVAKEQSVSECYGDHILKHFCTARPLHCKGSIVFAVTHPLIIKVFIFKISETDQQDLYIISKRSTQEPGYSSEVFGNNHGEGAKRYIVASSGGVSLNLPGTVTSHFIMIGSSGGNLACHVVKCLLAVTVWTHSYRLIQEYLINAGVMSLHDCTYCEITYIKTHSVPRPQWTLSAIFFLWLSHVPCVVLPTF